MNDFIYDVAIIGGGIAGCAAAIQLAQYNQRVILCETKTYPHHKVCGEFLSPECVALLENLGLMDTIWAVKPASIHRVVITAPNGTSWETELPGKAIGISRYTLDTLMAAQARVCGVDFRDLTTVTNVRGSLDSTFRLAVRTASHQEQIQARVVIGAYGKKSNIDRILHRPFLKSPQHFVGLKTHFCGNPIPNQIRLYTFPGGYCGLSEIENGRVNVCLLVRQEVFQQISHGSIDHFVEWMKSQNPVLGVWLSAARPVYKTWISIAQVSFGHREKIVDDILMVGDSSGLIAPIAGDGMAMALQASLIASSLLQEYLAGKITAETLRQQYSAIWGNTFRLRLRLSGVLQTFMLNPGWLTRGLQFINAVPALGHFLVNHTRDPHFIQT
jgi:menaquinone-9 beta-reductase